MSRIERLGPSRAPRALTRCFSVEDLRRLAHRRLPAPLFHYLDGGADDELSLRRSMDAFDDYELMPQHLCDVSSIGLSTTLLGRKIAVPFILAPTECRAFSITMRSPPSPGRGAHIVKALALGANACSIGRAYLFGLAAGGQRGVERALAILPAELGRDLALLGCARISDLSSQFLWTAGWRSNLLRERNRQ